MSRLIVFLVIPTIALPAAGALWAQLPLPELTEFPPRTIFVQHAPFSWLSFWIFAALVALVTAPCLLRAYLKPVEDRGRTKRFLPWYFWPSLAFMAAAWFSAWTRFPVLSAIQHHTFFPLWLGFILVANSAAAGQKRSPFAAAPGRYFLLFLASSAFWWYFEYLNRFVQNWSYQNVSDFGPLEYFLFATLSFSTVLPAVASTGAILGSSARFKAFSKLRPRPWLTNRPFLALLALVSSAGLFLLPLYPNALFPFVWVSPTCMVLAAFELAGRPSLLSQAAKGDFSHPACWAVSGLVCGFFWELWNYGSLARWIYHVPLVARFYLFEMPVLGFAGYLPFGILCGAVIEQIVPTTLGMHETPRSPRPPAGNEIIHPGDRGVGG